MSATSTTQDDKKSAPMLPPVDELAKSNPNVDRKQVREAQELLKELRREGVGGPSYGIVSPYERRAF